MEFEEWLNQPSTRRAIGIALILSVAYLLTVLGYFAPESPLQNWQEFIEFLFSPETAGLGWYFFGGYVLYLGIPLVLLLRFSLLIPFLLVVLEQARWLASNPTTHELGAPLSVLIWPVPLVLLLILAWVEYKIHVGLGLPVQPLISG
jgi:hypothetical protein